MRTLALATLVVLSSLVPTGLAKGATIHAGTDSDGSLYFRPSRVVVDEGERMQLTLVNDDEETPHDWALLEYAGRDIEVYARGGQSRMINFTANEVGEYRIVCQVVGHKQRGMEGTLVVEDKLLVPSPTLLGLLVLAGVAIAVRRRRSS